ncbi:MAG: hypothetical protein QG574_2623 [Cyanobacteriota bacterium erpe_2018_sw_21hr_WHONDRS-SW48-000092_B_bin.40]|jgi:hypothetical protein|nr:hypothetical protein [Cyanobacteriota bacterium erpe_2018_sw_21hr_WHONDRS-SW48-000092_B_bin.40]
MEECHLSTSENINDIKATESAPKRQLERARVDFSSTKTQMLLGALIMCVSCLIAYGQTVLVTFLGQDLTYIQAIADTLHGSFDQVLANPTSILLIDYLLYHTNTLGFHVSNILLTASCAIVVGLITLELTGRLGNRNGALSAIWAGMLFSVYPLHAQSVAIVSGRIELSASLFYLLSVFLFLRYRLIEEKQYFPLSLISGALALLLSAQSLSLPLVITLLALHPGRNRFAARKNALADAISCSGLYWLIAVLSFFLHPHYLGAVDKKTLLLLFFPVNETVISVSKIVPLALIPLLCALMVLLLKSQIAKIRLNQRTQTGVISSVPTPPSSTITALILLAWLALTILPLTAHDSHLFLAAAPFSILIAILSLESGNTKDKDAKLLTSCGLVAMTLLYLAWSYLLAINLKPTVEGSLIVENFRRQLINAATIDGNITLTNWPKNHQGVPLIGAAENINLFLAPPFIDRDLSRGLKVMKETMPISDSKKIYQWQQAHGLLASISQAVSQPFSSSNLPWSASSKDYFVTLLKGSPWQLVDSTSPAARSSSIVSSSAPVISLMKNSARLWAGDKQSILWLNDKIDQPVLQENRWILKIKIADHSASTVDLAVRNYLDETKMSKLVGKRIGADIFFDLRELDNYLSNGESQQIGIVVAAGEVVSISGVEFVSLKSAE